jgi:hypothetical protein
VLQVRVEVMVRTVQMEKFQLHQVLQDPRDHKDLQVQQGLQDPRDQLVQQALQDLVVELQGLQAQPVHRVHREVLDLRDLQVLPAQQVLLVQLVLPVHKVKQEQLVLQEPQVFQKRSMDQSVSEI